MNPFAFVHTHPGTFLIVAWLVGFACCWAIVFVGARADRMPGAFSVDEQRRAERRFRAMWGP